MFYTIFKNSYKHYFFRIFFFAFEKKNGIYVSK